MTQPDISTLLRQSASLLARRFDLEGREAAVQARLLVSAATGLTFTQLLMKGCDPAPQGADALVRRRLETGLPVQYLTGSEDFMGRTFRCDRRALIPRQDTELLAEAAVKAVGQNRWQVLDIGTGMGALAVTLALDTPARVTAADISREALSLAAFNAQRLGARVRFVQSDCTHALPKHMKFHLIVSNPPYLTGEEWRNVPRDVTNEPRLALEGGADGLAFYRRLALEAGRHLYPGGLVMLEIGCGQGRQVAEIFEKDYAEVAVHADLNGLPRLVTARKRA